MSKRPPLSYTTTRLTLGTFLRIMFRPRYLDRDKIPVDGPLIIAANHLSHIDPAFIMTATKRPVSYMSKKEHFDGAIRRLVFKQVGVIPVDRDAGGTDALKDAVKILKEGGAIGIFPEGTLTSIYLNDIKIKGGTCWPQQSFTSKPEAGDLYIWPAGWTHSHYGIPAPKENKYFMSGWCSLGGT